MGNWNELDGRGQRAQDRSYSGLTDTEKERLAQDRVCALAARVFGSSDGRLLLSHLRRMTKDRVMGPDASHSALAHLEGQRQLVHQLETWCAYGNRTDPSDLRASLADGP